MMKFRVQTQYALSEEDVRLLEQAGKEKKKYWSVKNLTKDQWINYGTWQLATTPFNAILVMEEGCEYQISAGHWDVMNGNRHANQKKCCYVFNGELYYCNYRELPSQGGMKGAGDAYPPEGVTLDSYQESNSPLKTSERIEYKKIGSHRMCSFNGDIIQDCVIDCPLCDQKDPMGPDSCDNCNMIQDLYVKMVTK